MEKVKNFWNKNLFSKVIIIFIVLMVMCIFGSMFSDTDDASDKTKLESKTEITVIDFSSMTLSDITTWCSTNKVECYTKEEYSDSVAKSSFVSQSVNVGDKIYEGGSITIIYSLGKEPSKEYKNALSQAKTYSETMHMSKNALYDQLISEYGGQFSKDAAQYAIDNVTADWNANALAQAKTYQETMSMSKNAIYDQLISQYGGQFTKTEAQYAIDHLDD